MRFRHAVLALALVAPLLPVPAVAAETLQCRTAVPIFVRHADTGLQLWQHSEPENGNEVWEPSSNIGFAWDGQIRTGPDGRVYEITPEGVVNRFRWNGSGWDDGGVGQAIATGWNGWGDAFAKNRMTIDAKGDFYGFPSDKALHWWRYDETNKTWTERVLDVDWGSKYDMIFASGEGELFARSTDGTLFHYTYHAESQRWTEYNRQVGWGGWGQFTDVASVGGGVFYAQNGNGQLKWYRYLGNGQWTSDSGKIIGAGWQSGWQIEGSPDACKLVGGAGGPTRPAITPDYTAPVNAYQGDDNLVNYFFVNPAGRLTHGKQRRTDDLLLIDHQDFQDYGQFTGTPGVAAYSDNKLEVQTQSHADSDARGKTQSVKNGAWKAGFNELGGHFASDPVLIKGGDNLLYAFAIDEQGGFWYRKQLVLWGVAEQGRFGAWGNLGGLGLTRDFTVVRNGTAIELVGRHHNGTVFVARFDGTTLGPWRTAGNSPAGRLAAVAHPDGKLQLVSRQADGKIYTQLETASGFPGTWQAIGDITAAGSPAAVLTTNNTLELSVRGTDGLVYTTGQNQPGGVFRNWEVRDFHEAGTDTTMINLRDNAWLITWRDPQGEIYTYRGTYGVAATQRSASTLTYTGGKSH